VLEFELDCLKEVLDNPARYLRIEPRQLRLDAMNVVSETSSGQTTAEVEFAVAELSGASTARRAFVLGRVERSELPRIQKINFDAAVRYL